MRSGKNRQWPKKKLLYAHKDRALIIKIVIVLLAFLNGGWMIFDGVHVIKKGKYFGPDLPGAWSKIVSSVGLDPFKLGPLFILIGFSWVVSAIALLLSLPLAWAALIVCSIITLWYIKVGTVISLLVLALLSLQAVSI